MVTLITTLTLSGCAFAVLEDVGVDTGLYWAVTTMTTTGYGDVSPQTGAGRALAGALMLWSIFFLLPAAIFHVAERLIHDHDEELAQAHDDEQTERLRRIEALLTDARRQ